LKYKPQLD
jgi:hypothetical protein